MLLTIRIRGFALFLILLGFACSNNPQETALPGKSATDALATIEQVEARFMNLINNNPGSPELTVMMLNLTDEYRLFGDQFPEHELASEMLFRAANLRADGLGEYQSAINLFNRIIRNYPESLQAERSLFLIAYTYAEYLSDYDKARLYYNRFLELHPDSELAPSVSVMLEFLGMDINELLQDFNN